MPFDSRYVSLLMNGINYTDDKLLAPSSVGILSNKIGADWQQSLHQFILDWVDKKDFIIVNTSGSTGKPKQIQLAKERMMNSAFMTGKYFGFKSGQTALLCLPCDYIAGKMMVLRSIMWGLDLQLVPPTGNPMETINQPIDFAAMVPLQVMTIFEQSPEKFKLIKKLIIGGGKVDAQLQAKLQTIPTECYATYGMTETITHVAIKGLNGKHKADYFQGLSNIQFATDARGCLTIHAPQLAQELVVTNDIIDLRNNQQFEWLGRIDNVINTGGVKVFPEKIEAKLEKIINVRFFITSFQDKKLENKVALIIESNTWIKEKINALKLDLKQVLSKFEQPKAIYFVAQFEETPTKKIQRQRTKEKVERFNL
ncbi:MAG: AMP-binding protein [Saprospiraceae bacterium]